MNWYEVVTYIVLFLMFLAGIRVVTTSNVIHAAISLVLALALSAALFLLLSADFVAWVLVPVYIGAVIVLFLFGIMITRAPLGVNAELDNEKKLIPNFLIHFSSKFFSLLLSFVPLYSVAGFSPHKMYFILYFSLN